MSHRGPAPALAALIAFFVLTSGRAAAQNLVAGKTQILERKQVVRGT